MRQKSGFRAILAEIAKRNQPQQPKQRTAEDERRIALHELSHAFAAAMLSSQNPGKVSIEPFQMDQLGMADGVAHFDYADPAGDAHMDVVFRQYLLEHACFALAGRFGPELCGSTLGYGDALCCRFDFHHASCITYVLTENIHAAYGLCQKIDIRVRDILDPYAHLINYVTYDLIRNREMSGEDVLEAIRRYHGSDLPQITLTLAEFGLPDLLPEQ